MAIEALRVEPCEDTISRKAAIDAFNTNINELVVAGKENADSVERYLNRVIDRIKQLPFAQPERKRGRWLPDNRPFGGFWVCSECKFPSEAFAADVLYKFCPNCGARMTEEK